MKTVRLDLSKLSVRQLNDYLHHRLAGESVRGVEILNPNGMHNIAVGLGLSSRGARTRQCRLFRRPA